MLRPRDSFVMCFVGTTSDLVKGRREGEESTPFLSNAGILQADKRENQFSSAVSNNSYVLEETLGEMLDTELHVQRH